MSAPEQLGIQAVQQFFQRAAVGLTLATGGAGGYHTNGTPSSIEA